MVFFLGCPVPGYNGDDCYISCSDPDCRKSHVKTGTCQGCDSRYTEHQYEFGIYFSFKYKVWNEIITIFVNV